MIQQTMITSIKRKLPSADGPAAISGGNFAAVASEYPTSGIIVKCNSEPTNTA